MVAKAQRSRNLAFILMASGFAASFAAVATAAPPPDSASQGSPDLSAQPGRRSPFDAPPKAAMPPAAKKPLAGKTTGKAGEKDGIKKTKGKANLKTDHKLDQTINKSADLNSEQKPDGTKALGDALPDAELAAPQLSKIELKGRRSPTAYLSARVRKLWSEIKGRPTRSASPEKTAAQAAANKQDWLREAYARNMVDASSLPFYLADKLLFAEILKQEMGPESEKYYPHTLGLKEFLEKRKLVNSKGKLTADPDLVEQALADEFPSGFVVRPAVGVAPGETERGLFPKSDQIVAELFKTGSPVYSPELFSVPIQSHLLGGIASGEAVVLQEDVLLKADAHKRLARREMLSARVHTYEGRVVPDAAPERWVSGSRLASEQEARAELFVAGFLSKLSERLLARQAWGVDVAVFDNGDMQIVDVVTNRGRKGAWSTYLDQPRVIGAYSRLWEERAGLAFEGLSGSILRHNLANYFPYWGKRIETAKAPWKKALALLPPLP